MGISENPEKSREHIISNKNGKRKQKRRNSKQARILQGFGKESVAGIECYVFGKFASFASARFPHGMRS